MAKNILRFDSHTKYFEICCTQNILRFVTHTKNILRFLSHIALMVKNNIGATKFAKCKLAFGLID